MADAANKNEEHVSMHTKGEEEIVAEPTPESEAAAPQKLKGLTSVGRAVLAHTRIAAAVGDKKTNSEESA